MSLRLRLLLAVGAVAIVALLAADLVTYTQLRSFLYDRVDQDLADTAHMPGPPDHGPQDGGQNPGSEPEAQHEQLQNGELLLIEIVAPTGQVLHAPQIESGAKYTPLLPSRISGYSKDRQGDLVAYLTEGSRQSGGPTFRVLAEKIDNGPSNGDILIVAEPVSDADATLRTLKLVEVIVSACALVVAAFLGWWLIRRSLRPLTAVERTAESIAAGELHERVPGANDKTEVGRLADTLNVMLGRIEEAFAQRDATESELRASQEHLRRFVADASHELRTPLAAVSAYAELFERGASERPEDLQRVLTGIRAETSRMGRLVEDLLLLARLDERIPLALDQVELVGIAADSVQTAQTVGPAWSVRLVAGSPVEVSGDGARIRQVIDNLLANVRAHTPPGTSATVEVRVEGDQAVIEVADTGPGLSDEQARMVFERFYRTDTSRSRSSGGAGLGLSIVSSIVAAHHGSVAAAGQRGGGTVFTVRIPLAVAEVVGT